MRDDPFQQESIRRIIGLIMTLRGWTQTQTALALKRDPGRLIPRKPTLAFIIELAKVLEWPITLVVDFICGTRENPSPPPQIDFDTLDKEFMRVRNACRWLDAITIARQLLQIATTPEQRALTWNREGTVWEGRGFFEKAMECFRNGLRQRGISDELRVMLESNLANVHYSLGFYDEALALAGKLLRRYEDIPPATRRHRVTQAFAYYVAGNAARCAMDADSKEGIQLAEQAEQWLDMGRMLHEELSKEFNEPGLAGIAHTCRGGLYEARCVLGTCEFQTAIQELRGGLESWTLRQDAPADWKESYGWWAIFGGRIALRYLQGGELQHSIRFFAKAARDIARGLDNHAMLLQAILLRHVEAERHREVTGLDFPMTTDDDDERILVTLAGRFLHYKRELLQMLFPDGSHGR